MIHLYLALPIILIGGLLNRVRGGYLPTGHTQVARGVFAVGMGLIMLAATFNFWVLLSIPLWFAGELLPNGDYLGMETVTTPAPTLWKWFAWLQPIANFVHRYQQFLEASACGLGNVLLPAGLLWALTYFHLFSGLWWALLIAGALKGCVYLIANHANSWWFLGRFQGFSKGAEMAECLFGLVLTAGAVASNF